MTTWIVAALDSELTELKAELHALPFRDVPGYSCYRGRIGRARVYLAAVGVGVVSAALSLADFSATIGADRIIMIGSGGALPGSELNVGDLAVASSEILSELGVYVDQGIGDAQSLALPGLSQEVPLDRRMADTLLDSATKHARVRLGSFLSVVGVSTDAGQAEARAQKFQPLVENMEGYALAVAGQRLNIPGGEVRAISNIAGIRDKSAWDLPLANKHAQAAVLTFLGRIL
jgi:futalosine hydrolase